uniref:Uncharacterized protein n=1 Tax=Hyaloperonospora arabidopsidis (strain Emoy2) TaxID=559515 RepID=M4C5G6_HYAAE
MPTYAHPLTYFQLLCPPTPIHCAGLRRYHQTNQSAQGEILCGCAGGPVRRGQPFLVIPHRGQPFWVFPPLVSD